jgi:Fe2+ transport system protein B
MSSENSAQIFRLQQPAERGALRVALGAGAQRNQVGYWQSAAANTANMAAMTDTTYTGLLPQFLNDEIPASKESNMSDMTREEMKAEIAASEARGDTKIARFEGKLDLVLAKLDSVNNSVTDKMKDVKDDVRSARANQWVIALGLAVLIVAVVTLFPVFFGIGTQLHDMVHSEVQSQIPTPPVAKRP